MRSIRLTLALALAALTALGAPLTASASHCGSNIIIFSGVDTGQTDHNGNPVRPGPNGSLVACNVDPADESLPIIVPGATNMVVAVTVGSPVPPEGTLTFNGVETALTFTWMQPLYATSPRWESQSVPTTSGTGPVTVTIELDGEEFGTVTYNKLV
jgi:hypothetical protein